MGRGPEQHNDEGDEEVDHDDEEGEAGQGKFHENVDNGLDELPPPPRRAPRERPGRSLLSLFPGATYSPRWSLSIVMMPFHHHDAIISISNTS